MSSANDSAIDQTFCCDRFAAEAGAHKAFAGGGFMYPDLMRPSAQFHRDDDGSWNVNGCCGGGCYVVTDMRFCPFCGASLTVPAPKARKRRVGVSRA